MRRTITVIIACALLLAALAACDAMGATNITPVPASTVSLSPTTAQTPIPAPSLSPTTESTPSSAKSYTMLPPTSSYLSITRTSQVYTTVPSDTKSLYPAGEVVVFKYKTVESSIRAALNIPTGNVTAGDMERMQIFRYNSVNDKSAKGTIRVLDDLRYCVNLEILWIIKQPVSSIEPLRKLDKLSILFIPNCAVSDLSPLEGKDSLIEARISGNPVSDASPVLGLPNLIEFNASWGTKVTDISAIPATSSLENFFCENKLKDFTPLLRLKNLRNVTLAGISDGFFRDMVQKFRDMSTIRIKNSDIKDESLKLLAGYSLYGLTLENCGLKDISGLADLASVSHLELGGNQIEDISALSTFTQIGYALNLNNNKISDFSPLENVRLSMLIVTGNPLTKTSKAVPDKLEEAGCKVYR